MSDPYLGEIRLFPLNFAPKGWSVCAGQTLSISQNQALFSILGNVYGGDGKTTFALPDLRGRTPVHFGPAIPLGSAKGEETHALTVNEMPTHRHPVQASTASADQYTPQGNIWASQTNLYAPVDGAAVSMNAGTVSNAGAGQPHSNMQPFLALTFCIALAGIYPSRN